MIRPPHYATTLPRGTRGRHNHIKVQVSIPTGIGGCYRQHCTQYLWTGGVNATSWIDTTPHPESPHRKVVAFTREYVRHLP